MTQTFTLPSPPDIKLFDERQLTTTTTTNTTNNDTYKRPLTPPLPPSLPPLSPTTTTTTTTTTSLSNITTTTATTTKSKSIQWEIIHDNNFCMFKIVLDSVGSTAALCYLPTRFQGIIEFYHLEIPMAYRHQGIGDHLLEEAFQWVERSKILVVPSCPFVHEYLESHFPDKKSGGWKYIVHSDYQQEGIKKE